MAQRIDITDNRNNELMTLTFPQHYVPQMISSPLISSVISGMMQYFTLRFDPPIDLSSREVPKKKLIILAAIAAAIEEGYI